jgi:hypothetical protein
MSTDAVNAYDTEGFERMSSMMTLESVYEAEDAQDQVEQDRRRQYEDAIAHTDTIAALAMITERMRDDELSELRAFVEMIQRVPFDDASRAVMPDSEMRRMGQQVALWAAHALDDLATQRGMGR